MQLAGNVFGHYKLLQRIGSGGMGEVYLAEDMRIERRVAVKVVQNEPDPYHDAPILQEATRLFQREMKAIVSLDHSNILPLLDFGEYMIEGTPYMYLVMPYRPEGSLVDWLRRKGGAFLPLLEVVPLVLQAADALQHAHHHQIVHLDVKASNFLVRNREENGHLPDLLLADFGIAHLDAVTATASQSIRGTPSSMAPEQWTGHPVAASDQYGLAIMVYQLLTNTFPFQGNMHQMMYQHLHDLPRPPSVHNRILSVSLDTVLLRALSKKPEDRFPSILAFAVAFQEACQGEQSNNIHEIPDTVIAPPLPPVSSPATPILQAPSPFHISGPRTPRKRQHKLPLMIAIGSILVALGGTLLFVWLNITLSTTSTNSFRSTQLGNTNSSHTTIPSTTPISSPSPTSTPTPTVAPTPLPTPSPRYPQLKSFYSGTATGYTDGTVTFSLQSQDQQGNVRMQTTFQIDSNKKSAIYDCQGNVSQNNQLTLSCTNHGAPSFLLSIQGTLLANGHMMGTEQATDKNDSSYNHVYQWFAS